MNKKFIQIIIIFLFVMFLGYGTTIRMTDSQSEMIKVWFENVISHNYRVADLYTADKLEIDNMSDVEKDYRDSIASCIDSVEITKQTGNTYKVDITIKKLKDDPIKLSKEQKTRLKEIKRDYNNSEMTTLEVRKEIEGMLADLYSKNMQNEYEDTVLLSRTLTIEENSIQNTNKLFSEIGSKSGSTARFQDFTKIYQKFSKIFSKNY